jgi:hypothetical protein
LIDELRATLFHHDSTEEFDTGNCDDEDDGDDDERERLLRLLEDVMRKVRQLAENDTPRCGDLGPSVTMTAVAPWGYAPHASLEKMSSIPKLRSNNN